MQKLIQNIHLSLVNYRYVFNFLEGGGVLIPPPPSPNDSPEFCVIQSECIKQFIPFHVVQGQSYTCIGIKVDIGTKDLKRFKPLIKAGEWSPGSKSERLLCGAANLSYKCCISKKEFPYVHIQVFSEFYCNHARYIIVIMNP